MNLKKDPVAGMRRTVEDEYFLRKEQELLASLRKHAQHEAGRAHLAEATGIADAEILRELHDLGFSPDTVPLFYMVPLLQVAWADGFVTAKERALIVDVARARNIEEGKPCDIQLQKWLEQRPSDEFFDRTNRIIRVLLEALAVDDRSASPDRLVALCVDVASVSGGFLGFGSVSEAQRLAIEKVAAALELRNPTAVEAVVANDRGQDS